MCRSRPRSKEIFSRGGKKFSREVEEFLYTHPRVMHVATIGIPDARLGERNCLCVVPERDVVPALEGFVAFLRDQVADYKLPESVGAIH
jgi:non-ribosomal peptide synthetase component E (peptide arylation enzyme)